MKFRKKINIAMAFWLTAISYIVSAQLGGFNPITWGRAWIVFVLVDGVLIVYYFFGYKNRPQ